MQFCIQQERCEMLFAFLKSLIADQDGEGRIELMLAAQVVLAAIAL